MRNIHIIALAGLLTVCPNVKAAFVASDFEISIGAFDVGPLSHTPAQFSFSFTNVSDQTATFGQNIFTRGGIISITIEDVPYVDSEYVTGDFWFLFPEEDVIAPGQTIGFGGITISLLPNTPIGTLVTLNSLGISLSNNPLNDIPPSGDQRFSVFYTGPPVSSVVLISTPVPAAGLLFFPALLSLFLWRHRVTRSEV